MDGRGFSLQMVQSSFNLIIKTALLRKDPLILMIFSPTGSISQWRFMHD